MTQLFDCRDPKNRAPAIAAATSALKSGRLVVMPTDTVYGIGAAAFDSLTQSLQKTLGFTVFLITHDLDTLYAICDRVAVLADRKVIGVGTIPELLAMDHPWIQEYFNGPRGRAATAAVDRNSETRA